MSLSRELAQIEMQTASSGIWSEVIDSNSNNDRRYARVRLKDYYNW